jgi:hypothetical protein
MSTHGRVTFGSGAIGLATWTLRRRGERVRLVNRSGTKIAAELDPPRSTRPWPTLWLRCWISGASADSAG